MTTSSSSSSSSSDPPPVYEPKDTFCHRSYLAFNLERPKYDIHGQKFEWRDGATYYSCNDSTGGTADSNCPSSSSTIRPGSKSFSWCPSADSYLAMPDLPPMSPAFSMSHKSWATSDTSLLDFLHSVHAHDPLPDPFHPSPDLLCCRASVQQPFDATPKPFPGHEEWFAYTKLMRARMQAHADRVSPSNPSPGAQHTVPHAPGFVSSPPSAEAKAIESAESKECLVSSPMVLTHLGKSVNVETSVVPSPPKMSTGRLTLLITTHIMALVVAPILIAYSVYFDIKPHWPVTVISLYLVSGLISCILSLVRRRRMAKEKMEIEMEIKMRV